MISFGACGDCHDNLLFQTAMEQLVGQWVESYVAGLYQLLDEERSTAAAGGTSGRRSALLALWGMALVQVSHSKCTGFSPQSLLPILESTSAQAELYDCFDQVSSTGLSAVETAVMSHAYAKLSSLQQQSHQFSGALIPFCAMLEDNFWAELQPETTTFGTISHQLPRMIGTKFPPPPAVGSGKKKKASPLDSSAATNTIDYLRRQLKSVGTDVPEDLLDVFLLTTPEGRVLFSNDIIAERFLDACMQHEHQRLPRHTPGVSPEPPSPYYLLILHLVRVFQEHARNHHQQQSIQSMYSIDTLLRHVFASPPLHGKNKSMDTTLEYSWLINKVHDFHNNGTASVESGSGNVITDNKTLLALLAGLALFPTDTGIFLDASKIIAFPNWTVNIPDAIIHVRQSPSFAHNQEALTSMSHARLLLCTSVTFASMGQYFSNNTTTTPVDMSALTEQLMLQTIHVLTLDAKYVLEQVGVPSVKADLVEASKELFLSPNVLSFLVTLVADYLLFANVACFHMTRKTYDQIGGERLYMKGVIEGLQEILSLVVTDRMNTDWVHFYRMLLLHDFSKQMDKQKKKYQLCDHLIDHMLATMTTATTPSAPGYALVCIDDVLNQTVDLVFATRAVGDLDAVSDLLEQLFYWETLPFNIQRDTSYQNTYRHLFHLERLALGKMTNPEAKSRGMTRLARMTHWIFSSTHNESNERSRLMQCVMLDSPELAIDLSAMIKTLYESGSQQKCPLAFIADIIDLSTFSNKNEMGSISRPISITNLELILKQHFYRLPRPTSDTMPTWLLSKRNYAACLFVQLWGTVYWGQRNGISDNGLMHNVWSEFIKLNGTFNDQSQTWIRGQYEVAGTGVSANEDEDQNLTCSVFDDDQLVFTRPGAVDWTESTQAPPAIPSLLRRKFDDVDEANIELGEDELFVLQPVYGTIVHVKSPAHQSPGRKGTSQAQQYYFSGYLCVEGLNVYLPFHLASEYEVQLLEANGKAPYLYQRCSFYVGFKCQQVFAFCIQRAVDENDRVSYYDMMHAERIGRSNNPLYQPRMIRERPFRPKMPPSSDGLNFMEYNMTAAPTMEVTKVFNLSDSDYSDLLKNYKDTGSIPIQLLSAKEFNMDNVTGMVGLQKHIYGRLNFLCTALHTPYEGFDTLPNKATGWIACPVSRSSPGSSTGAAGADLKSIFPWIEKNTVDPGYLDKQIHWIARDVVSLFVDKAPKFGGSKPTRKVVPQKMDLYESATESYCRKMFVFVSFPKLSLVSVPEGLLVMREQSQGGTGHFFDLGVLYFDNKTVHDTRNYLTTIWRRTVECILSSNWQYLSDIDPSINDSVENIARNVVTNIEEPVGVGVSPSIVPSGVSSTSSTAPAIFTTNMNSVAPSLSMSMNSSVSAGVSAGVSVAVGVGGGIGSSGGPGAVSGAMSFLSASQNSQQQQQQQALPYFMDMTTAPSVVEPLFPPASSSVSSTTSPSTPHLPSYLGIIGQGSLLHTDPPSLPLAMGMGSGLSPPTTTVHTPGSFASVLAEASSPTPSSGSSLTSSPKVSSTPSSSSATMTGMTKAVSTESQKNHQPSVTSKHYVISSLDGRHGDFKVFVKNLKDFSVSEIQEILGDDVRSITLKLTNKQPNGMCHMTFRTKTGYLAALNRNYEVIAPSINLSISKDTSNDSKFNIDNPVYFTYDEEESVNYDTSAFAQPSASLLSADGTMPAAAAAAVSVAGVHGPVLPSTLLGTHGDYYAFVRGLFYFNSYEVQSFLGTDVRSVTLKMDEDGRPNGMSHVTFNTQEGFAAAIGRNNEYIRGKQQLRIAADTKKDLANGSCRTVYFRKPNSGKGVKRERKLKGSGGKSGKASHANNSSTSGHGKSGGGGGGRSRGGGGAYGAYAEEEWQTK